MASSEIVGTTCSVRAYISTGIITIHPGASQGFGFATCNVEVLKVSSLASCMRLLGSLAVMGPGGSAVWGGSIGPIGSFKLQ